MLLPFGGQVPLCQQDNCILAVGFLGYEWIIKNCSDVFFFVTDDRLTVTCLLKRKQWETKDFMGISLLRRRSLDSSRNIPPPRTSAETQGYLSSPITVHFPIKAVKFCRRLQRIPAWPFNEWVDIKTVDLNLYQQKEVKTNGKSARRFDRISVIIKLKSEDRNFA